MSAASRNDAAPILGVLLERISLEWIDLVAYEAHDRHWYPLHGRSGRCIAASGQRRDRCQDAADGFAAADRHGCGPADPPTYLCRTRPIRCAPHELATITSRARWASRCMTASRHWAGCQAAQVPITLTTSHQVECRRSKLLVLISRQLGNCDVV